MLAIPMAIIGSKTGYAKPKVADGISKSDIDEIVKTIEPYCIDTKPRMMKWRKFSPMQPLVTPGETSHPFSYKDFMVEMSNAQWEALDVNIVLDFSELAKIV